MIGKNVRSTFTAALIALLGGPVFLISVDVSAQQAGSSELEEIVVTARRRAESMQEIPISVVAVSGDQIEQLSIQTMGDLTQAVPNSRVEIFENAAHWVHHDRFDAFVDLLRDFFD